MTTATPTAKTSRPEDIPEGWLHHGDLRDAGWPREVIENLKAIPGAGRRSERLVGGSVSPWWFDPAAVAEARDVPEIHADLQRVEAERATAAKKEAAAAKRRATLAAKEAAAAALDAAIAREAGYPDFALRGGGEISAAVTKDATNGIPRWFKDAVGRYAVLLPADAAAVGSVIAVVRATGERTDQRITRLIPMGCKAGVLLVRAEVEDAALAAKREASAAAERERRAVEQAAQEVKEAAARAERATIKAAAEIEAEALRARIAARRETWSARPVAERIDELRGHFIAYITSLLEARIDDDDRMMQGFVAASDAVIRDAAEHPEWISGEQVIAALARMEETPKTPDPVRLWDAVLKGMPRSRGVLEETRRCVLWRGLIAAGSFDLTLADVRRGQARFARHMYDPWVVLAPTGKVAVGKPLLVETRNGNKELTPVTVTELGRVQGFGVALITAWKE